MSGETVFPLAEAGSAGRLPTESLSTAAALELGGAGFAAACGAGSSALKVRPAKGAALLFYSQYVRNLLSRGVSARFSRLTLVVE